MSLNHSLGQSQFGNPIKLGGRLETVHFDAITANEFFIEDIDISGNITLANTSTITQGSNIITPTTFGYLSKINQELSTIASPHFVQINSDLNGQVLTSEQRSITSLPNISTIQGTTLSSSVWPYVASMNQNVATTSNVNFGKINSQGTDTSQVTVKTLGGSTIVNVNTTAPSVTFNSDVTVNGNITYNTVTEIKTVDPMIALADGNLTNTLDIGIYGTYSTSPPTKIFTGLFRDHTNSLWTFYDNLATEPSMDVPTPYTTASVKLNSVFSSNGSVTNPAYSFVNDANSGLYRIGSNNYGFSIASTKIIDLSATGLGTLTITPFVDSTYNLGSALLKYANIYATNLIGTLATTTQPNIASLAGLTSIQGQSIASSAWQYVNTMNQNVATTSSPSFGTVTATFIGNLTGNVTGNVSGSAATVTGATQSAITTLPSLTSIQGQSISSGSWQYVNSLNQSVATTGTPTFTSVKTPIIYAGGFSMKMLEYTQPGSTDYIKLGNGSTLPFTIVQLGRTDNGAFVRVNDDYTLISGSYAFGVNGTSYFNNDLTCATTITATTFSGSISGSQPITALPNLTSIQGQSIGSSVWPYVANMNQNVSSGSSPTFANITSSGYVHTNTIASTTNGNITITAPNTYNLIYTVTGGSHSFKTLSSSTFKIDDGTNTSFYVNPSNQISIGTTSNPNGRPLYVSGIIESSSSVNSAGLNSTALATITSSTDTQLHINGAATTASGGFTYGINMDGSFNPSGGATDVRVVNANASIFATAAQTITNAIGLYSSLFLNSHAGIITNAYGLYVESGTGMYSGTITNGYGAYINLPAYGSSKTALYVNGLTTINGTLNATILGGTLSTASQPNITTLAGLTSIQGQSIASSAWQYVNSMNQSVASSASPTFVTINGTIGTASQPNITTLAGLTSIQGQSIASSTWQYVNSMNQSVGSSATPTFDATTINTAAAIGLRFGGSATSVSSNNQYGILFNGSFAPTLGASGTVAAININPSFVATTGHTVSSCVGLQIDPFMNGNAGIITNFYGAYISTGTNMFSGSVTNAYGLYISNPSFGTTKLALYCGGDATVVGNLTAGNITGVTFTPTFSNFTNITSMTNSVSCYTYIGNVVTLNIQASVTPSATTGGYIFRVASPVAISNSGRAVVIVNSEADGSGFYFGTSGFSSTATSYINVNMNNRGGALNTGNSYYVNFTISYSVV